MLRLVSLTALAPLWIAAAPSPSRPGVTVPDRPFDILSLHLDITLHPESHEVSGTARYTAQPLHDGDFVLNRVDVDILAVRNLDGPAPTFHVYGDFLVIQTNTSHLGDNGQLDLEVDFRSHPWTGVHFREKGVADAYSEVWTQGEAIDHRHWFPAWDHPADRFTYTGTVHAPDGWRAFTNSGHDLVTYLIMFAAGPYEEHVHPTEPGIRVWLPPNTPKPTAERVLLPVSSMMTHFAERTGKAYPWGDYLQVFVQRFPYYGMENTGATINASRALLRPEVQDTSTHVENLVAHELAHQWFGDDLTCRSWPDLWLNEGFATYMAADWMQATQPTEAARDALRAEHKHRWYDASRDQSQPMARRWFHEDGPANSNVYNRGAATLEMLRAEVGDTAFWNAIRAYVAQNGASLVETVDLQRAFEDISGRDLAGVFQQWVESPRSPAITVTESISDNTLHITVTQERKDDRPRFSFPVELDISVNGAITHLSDRMNGDSVRFSVPADGTVDWVAFDPQGAVMATVVHKQSPERLSQMALQAAPFARIRAIRELGETDASEALATLLANAQEPRPYRVAAARALSAQRVHGPLIAALEDPEAPIRLAAAQGLATCPDPAVAPALARIVDHDPNPMVRGAALTSLAHVSAPDALRRARTALRATERESVEWVQAAQAVLGKYGDAADLPRLLRMDVPYRNRNTSVTAAAQLALREHDDAKRQKMAREVARAAEVLLQDLDLRTRQTALGVLQQVGDERSIDLVEKHRRTTREPDEQAQAERALQAMRSRTQAPAPTSEASIQARLEALEESLKDIRSDIDDLEARP